MSFDLFRGVPDTTYDVNRFYTRSTNEHDHSINVQVRIPPEMHSRISAFVNNTAMPYSSVQAFIRDAIHHRAEWCAATDGDFELAEVLAMERILIAQQEIEHRRKVEREMVEMIESNLLAASEDRDWNGILTTCDALAVNLFTVTMSPEARKRVQRVVDDARWKADTELERAKEIADRDA